MSGGCDLTDLRLFVQIVETGSITAGSRAASLSLAAGSERVKGLERAFATPLLTRGRRGAWPTAAGLALLEHAHMVLQQAQWLGGDLQEHARSRKQHIALVGTSAAMREYLPDALGDFLAGHPQVNVTTAEAPSEDSVQALLAGSADIAFVTDRAPTPGLELYPFAMNRFALAVPRGHALVLVAEGGALCEAQADGCDVVGLVAGSALQDTWDQRAAARGVALNYRVRVPSFEAQLRLIERGVGIALLPEASARRAARSMAIEVLLLSDAALMRPLLIAVRCLRALPAHAQHLVEHLRGAAGAVRST